MSRCAILFGTDHRFQVCDAEIDKSIHEKFKETLRGLVFENEVRGIAEEYNVMALAENGLDATTVHKLAFELGLPHRYCDPDRQQRIKLGILQENDIRASMVSTEEQKEQDIQESHRKRETYWSNELDAFDNWPVVYICGAEHIDSFSRLLGESGVEVIVAAHSWDGD